MRCREIAELQNRGRLAGESGTLKLMPSHFSTEIPIAPVGMEAVTKLAPAATFPQVLAFAKALDATVPVGQVVMLPALAAGALALIIIPTTAIGKN